MNFKINLTSLPSWDGIGTSVIDYLAEMAGFQRLREQMAVSMAQIATQRWTDRAKKWWEALPVDEQTFFSSHWDHMLIGIRYHFLDDTWVRARMQECEEMRFRQSGHYKETPSDFIHRHIRHHSILHPNELDGPNAISRLLRTQPVAWGTILNSVSCPSILELLSTASRMDLTLDAQFLMSESLKNSSLLSASASSSYPRRAHKRDAHAAEVRDETAELNSESGTETDHAEPKEVLAVQSRNRSRSQGPGRRCAPKARVPSPEGRTIECYSLTRNDSVVSEKRPNGICFICTSPMHFHRDCPHFGRFEILRSAAMINVDLDLEDWKEQAREYVALLVQSKAEADSSSYIQVCVENSPETRKPLAGMRNSPELKREYLAMHSLS